MKLFASVALLVFCVCKNNGAPLKLNVANVAYRHLWMHEPGTCVGIHTPPPTDTSPCSPTKNRSILVVRMFAHEVDTLEIVLHENEGLADVMLVENLRTHNIKASNKPYYMWQELKRLDRFKRFQNNVLFRECGATRKEKHAMWDAESDDNDCMSDHVSSVKHKYDVIVVGSVDEMLSRRNIYKLKHCDTLPPLFTGSAISTGFGLLSRSCRTDWADPNHRWSFILPTTYTNRYSYRYNRFDRQLKLRDVHDPIVGGVHLTNYCFLPNMILKELWATEYLGAFNKGHFCSKSIQEHKKFCLNNIASKKQCRTPGAEYETPRLIKQCTDRFPSWEGKVDPREELLYRIICS